MSECVYSDVIFADRLKSGNQVEAAVDSSKSADAVKHQNLSTKRTEDTDTKRNNQPPRTETDNTRSRCYIVTAVCVPLLLCVLLLVAVTVLWIKLNKLNTENNHLQTRYNNLTIERDQLWREREELLTLSKSGWRFYNSNVYYVSTEKKTWNESRQACIEEGADLVIINSKEEHEFTIKVLHASTTWIGLTDSVTEDVWKWVDGTNVTTPFWGYNEPSKHGDEDCAVTNFSSDPVNNWADFGCDTTKNWICEKRIFN